MYWPAWERRLSNSPATAALRADPYVADEKGSRCLQVTLSDMVATGAKTPQGRQVVGHQEIMST